ncbi:hypothetical protein NOF55_02405 [Rhizobiaceae bacterium BDR2-2]|uniref:GAF domain-containing protein n=1 Tax=Ectorhizobium quercum TaxID=2965071 RepID=A0AAE3STH1_9HYPH|nr:GAF domain-containing protein [Ectorhizobium quercum]MCX8995947.1 hypothetical protein [Ectorhizobium quercum]
MFMHDRKPTLDDIARLVSVTTGPLDPAGAYRALDEIVAQRYGHKLFTLFRFIEKDMEIERLHSSNLDAYPLLGRKKKQDTVWGETVLDRGEVLISRNRDDIRNNFTDFATIFDLGIGGMINVPLIWNGSVIGSVNISHDEGRFTAADSGYLKMLAGIVAPVVAATFRPA